MLSSLSDVDPKLYEHVRELGDAEKARMCRTLGLNLNSLRLRELANASSCPQQKQKLMELDTEIIVLAKLKMKYLSDVTKKDEFISHLHKASQWTIRTLNTLHKQLTPNLPQNQLKKSPSHSKMEHLHLQLVHLLISYHIIQEPEYDLSSEVDIDDDCFEYMMHSYQYCEAGDETLELIKKLRVIQQTTEPDVKKKIEDQIQLLKKLPIEQMCIQAEKLVKELGPMNENFDRFLGAQAFLIQTCNEITQICNIFAEASIKEHASNGVDQILQLLVNKVVAFEEKWKQEHAPFITPSLISFDRSEPKRQKIEHPIHGMSRSLHSRTDGNRSMLLT